MFKDRVFNMAIIISTMWHLFWVSAICIVVTPSVQPTNAYHEIDFLGPILEKTAFDLMIEEVKPQAETLYARSALFLDNVYLKPEGPGRKVPSDFVPGGVRDKIGFSLRDYIEDAKETPLYFEQESRITYIRQIGKRKDLLVVEGPARTREIIFKPRHLTVSHGIYGDAEEHFVKLRFFISGNGLVHDVEPIVSSGYPQIDIEAIRFLKKWRFSPSSLVEKAKSSWGTVAVKVEVK